MTDLEFIERRAAILDYRKAAVDQCNLLYTEIVNSFLDKLHIKEGVKYVYGKAIAEFSNFDITVDTGGVTVYARVELKTGNEVSYPYWKIYSDNTQLKLKKHEEDG